MAEYASNRQTKSGESSPIYHEVAKHKVMACKVYGAATAVMVSIAVIFCLAKGPSNTDYYLLMVNLIISSLVGVAVSWWYRKGDLDSSKLWFIFLVATVIIFQCIISDIYVWNHHSPSSDRPASTIPPITYFTPVNFTKTQKPV